MFVTVDAAVRTFDFFRDTFAFRNELMWQYSVDEKTGRISTRKNIPAPTYAHRCFVVVRSAKQFFLHATFRPDDPACRDSDYAKLIRQVVRRNPARAYTDGGRIVIPGFANLREFSASHERLLKQNCGGAWQSYVNKQHWRMLCPFTRAHQAGEAERLKDEILRGNLPVIHVVRFPQLTINHALLMYGFEVTDTGARFTIYDPNLPENPSALDYDARTLTFELPRNIYWAGGRVDVYETYRD